MLRLLWFLTVSVQGHEVPFQHPLTHIWNPLQSVQTKPLFFLSSIFFSLVWFFFILKVMSHIASQVGLELTLKSPSWLHTLSHPPASVSQVLGFPVWNGPLLAISTAVNEWERWKLILACAGLLRVRVQMAEEGRSPDPGQCGGTRPARGTKITGKTLESSVLVWL